MVTEGTGSHRFGWPVWRALVKVGALLLALSVTTLRAEPSSDNDGADVESSLAEFRRAAKLNVELSETNFNRRLAAERQLEAVKAAFDAETTSLDQLLEAQRRLAEARVSYARTSSDLATDPAKREYVFTLACLTAFNQALNDARKIWKEVHREYVVGSGGGEAHAEAQAREQYFQFKTQTQLALTSYLKAKEAWEARETGQSPPENKSKD